MNLPHGFRERAACTQFSCGTDFCNNGVRQVIDWGRAAFLPFQPSDSHRKEGSRENRIGLVRGWEGLREDGCCGEGWQGVQGWGFYGGWEGLRECGRDSPAHHNAGGIGDFEAVGGALVSA